MPRSDASPALDDARLQLDLACLELAQSDAAGASEEGLGFLIRRVRITARRYEAVLSQHERDRPFEDRCRRLSERRDRDAIAAHLGVPGVLVDLLPLELLDLVIA